MERQINREQKYAQTLGAVVFIVDNEGRIYTQMETESRESSGKKAGEYSTICETKLPGEKWQENVIRGILEETGIDIGQLPLVLKFSGAKSWEAKFTEGVSASISIIPCRDSERFLRLASQAHNHDGVIPIGFVSREDFQKLNLRQGVRNILESSGDLIFGNEKPNTN